MKKLVYASAVLFLAACAGKSGDKKAELEKLKKERADISAQISKLEAEVGTKQEVVVREVSFVEVTPTVFKNYLEVQGKVDAEENVQVSPEAPGVVTAVYVKAGQRVGRGQVLAQIDDKVLRQNMAQLQTQLDLANNLFRRQKNLWDQKIGTEVQYLNAKTQKEGLERQMGGLRSQLRMYKIKSPSSGTVDAMDLKVGSAVSPGMSQIRVVNAGSLKAKAQVAESYAGRVSTGDEVSVTLPDVPTTINSRITFASTTIDPASRSFNVEVKLPAGKGYRPNMVAVLKIVDYANDKALTIPVNAIQKAENGDYVYVADNGKAKRVNISQGKVADGKAEIISGLKTGDKVITSGLQDLNEGDTVKI